MKYSDGNESKPGDTLKIDGEHQGIVVACIDTGEFLPGHEQWGYLKLGIMVNTSFGGLVHYTPEATDELVLISRGCNP